LNKIYDPANEVQCLYGGMIVTPLVEIEHAVVVVIPADIHDKAVATNSMLDISKWIEGMGLDPFWLTPMQLDRCLHLQFDDAEAVAEARQVFAHHGVEVVDWPAAVAGVNGGDSPLTETEHRQILDTAKYIIEWSRRQESRIPSLWPFKDAETDLLLALWQEGFGAAVWNDAVVETHWDDDEDDEGREVSVVHLIIKPLDRSWHCGVLINIDQYDDAIINVENAFGDASKMMTRACFNWFVMAKCKLS
jgi:hypothetical protein